MRYFFRVEYDGTRFGGWQKQNTIHSVQQTLSAAFSTITRTPCQVVGAGRTDAGVHARAQGAHVDISEPIDVSRCQWSVNSVLPNDVCIYNLQPVPADFHARFSAVKRRYKFYIADHKRPLLYKRVWMLYYNIDWNLVEHNIPALVGSHDFSTFCATGSSALSTNCTVYEASLALESGLRVFTITANRFVYSMVRSVMGTLVDIGRGKIKRTMEEIITLKKRKAAGETAPPFGLVLDYVEYNDIHDKDCIL